MSSMMLALTGFILYSPNSFPLLQMASLILPTVSLPGFRVMLLLLVLLANNDCAIDRTGSSSNYNRVNVSIGFC